MTIEEIILEYQGCKTILEVNNLTNVIDEIIYRYTDQQTEALKKEVEVLKEEIRILKIYLKHV